MPDTDQQLASRLRRLLEADAYISDSRELLTEYQSRVKIVNDRLAIAGAWLSRGLLSEAIGFTEEFPDALDAARDLDLGNENYARLGQKCRESALEVPLSVDRQAGWEISCAYVVYREASQSLDRYRAACMSGHPIDDRLVALRDTCVSVAKTRRQLGPAGEVVLRTLARQAGPLIETRLKGLKNEVATAQRARDNARIEVLLGSYGVLKSAADDLSALPAGVTFDVVSDPAVRGLVSLRDRRDLGLLLDTLAADAKANNVEALRTGLKVLAQIAERGHAAVPSTRETDLKRARELVDAEDKRTDKYAKLVADLQALVDDAASTTEQLEEAYATLAAQGEPPSGINAAYKSRRERDQQSRRARRRLMAIRGGIGALAAIVVVAGVIGVWMWRTKAERAKREAAITLAENVIKLVGNNSLDAARKELTDAGELAKREEVDPAKKKLEDAEAQLNAFKATLGEVIALSGLEPEHLTRAESALVLAEGTSANPGLGRESVDGATKERNRIAAVARAAREKEDALRRTSADINRRLGPAGSPVAHAGLAAQLAAYEACDREFEAAKGDRPLSEQVSKAVADEIERHSDRIATVRDELRLRLDVVNAIERGEPLGRLVTVYRQYRDADNPHKLTSLTDALRNVLTDEQALTVASPAFESMASVSERLRPANQEEAKARVEACVAAGGGLFPGVEQADLTALRSYFEAYQFYFTDTEKLGLAAVEREFAVAPWRQLKTVVDDKGRRHFSVGGTLEPRGSGHYALDRCPVSNKQYDGADNAWLKPMIKLEGAPKLAETQAATAADDIVRLMRDAQALKVEPLTVNMVAAERLRSVTMPAPLKGRLLRRLLDAQRALPWPDCSVCATLVAAIDQGGNRLRDEARWTPDEDDTATLESHRRFNDQLASATIGDLEQFAATESDRIAQVAKRVGAIKMVGVVWKTSAGPVAWSAQRSAASAGPRGTLYAITTSADRPVLRKVGAVSATGALTWEAGSAPPDGTPLFGQN